MKIQVWKSTKSNNSKNMMPRVMVLVHSTSPQLDLSSYSYMLMPCIILKLCSGQNSSTKINKGQ